MMKKKALLLIPARYGSERFPGKPLARILGLSMIQRVWEGVAEVQELLKETFEIRPVVVTDDERIEQHVKSFSGEVCRIDDDVSSGSERIYLAYQRFYNEQWDLLVNIQGDEPLISASSLSLLIESHLKSHFDIMTMVRPRFGDRVGFVDPNKVKAVFSSKTGQCLYFSRAPVPFCNEKESLEGRRWDHHIGVYSYRPESLRAFCQSERGSLEKKEKLEQLRALELGQSIGAIEIDEELIGVDTPDDIKIVEGVLSGR